MGTPPSPSLDMMSLTLQLFSILSVSHQKHLLIEVSRGEDLTLQEIWPTSRKLSASSTGIVRRWNFADQLRMLPASVVLDPCILDGGWIPNAHLVEPQCSNYKDCDCRDNPSNCFCRGYRAKCVTSAWECHSSKDCKKMEKCKDKECICHGSLCEHECDTANDCVELRHHCNRAEGHHCGCKQSVCTYELDQGRTKGPRIPEKYT